MPIMFNTLLSAAGFPLADVRLIRHKDNRADRGRSPYELWRDNRSQFELYQSGQSTDSRKKLSAQYWAVFIANFNDETMFAGLYRVIYRGLLKKDTPMPHISGLMAKAGKSDVYDLTLSEVMSDMIGRLFIEWGAGKLAWVQYAERNDKAVTELRTAFVEEKFPGFLNFVEPLSRLATLPKSWETSLRLVKGVYLLTCPKTKEWYIGSATGADGFWGRWQNYLQSTHPANHVG
jgi:hypothetical protein